MNRPDLDPRCREVRIPMDDLQRITAARPDSE